MRDGIEQENALLEQMTAVAVAEREAAVAMTDYILQQNDQRLMRLCRTWLKTVIALKKLDTEYILLNESQLELLEADLAEANSEAPAPSHPA